MRHSLQSRHARQSARREGRTVTRSIPAGHARLSPAWSTWSCHRARRGGSSSPGGNAGFIPFSAADQAAARTTGANPLRMQSISSDPDSHNRLAAAVTPYAQQWRSRGAGTARQGLQQTTRVRRYRFYRGTQRGILSAVLRTWRVPQSPGGLRSHCNSPCRVWQGAARGGRAVPPAMSAGLVDTPQSRIRLVLVLIHLLSVRLDQNCRRERSAEGAAVAKVHHKLRR